MSDVYSKSAVADFVIAFRKISDKDKYDLVSAPAIEVEMDCSPLIEEAADASALSATLTQSPTLVTKISFDILGMTNRSCVDRIVTTTQNIKGVESVKVNLSQACATFYVRPELSEEDVANVLKLMGFEVKSRLSESNSKMATLNISIIGMKCGKCEKKVTNSLLSLPGVTSADVSQPNSSACIRYDATFIEDVEIIDAVRSMNYSVDILIPYKVSLTVAIV